MSRLLLGPAGTLAALVLTACVTGRPVVGPPAPARDPLVTDRPDFTESPSVVGRRTVQLEAGTTYARSRTVASSALGEVLIRAGVADRAEVRVGLNSYVRSGPVGAAFTDRVGGWEDASVGAKLAIVEPAAGGGPAVSLLVGTSLPTGSRSLRRAAPEPDAKLALAWALGERWAVSSNLNYALLADVDGGRTGEASASLSLGRALAPRVSGYLEAYAFRPRGADGTQYVNGGATVLLTNDLQLDARVGAGVGRGGRDYFGGLGVARRW